MILHTASEVLSLFDSLENSLADFYEQLSTKYADRETAFLSIASENRKNLRQITRAYQEVISDAIEGCFAFNINTDDHAVTVTPSGNASQAEDLGKLLDMETRMRKLYLAAAEQSKSLLADVPRVLVMLARRREERILLLRSLKESLAVREI